VHLFTKI
jgi:hypothetical protein